MILIVDISGSKTSFDDMAHELDKLGQEIGVKILCPEKRFLPVCTESKSKYFQKGRKTND